MISSGIGTDLSSSPQPFCGEISTSRLFLMYRHYARHNPPLLIPIFATLLTIERFCRSYNVSVDQRSAVCTYALHFWDMYKTYFSLFLALNKPDLAALLLSALSALPPRSQSEHGAKETLPLWMSISACFRSCLWPRGTSRNSSKSSENQIIYVQCWHCFWTVGNNV